MAPVVVKLIESVGNISNEELQRLLAKVLAGELKNPGNFSFRALDIVRNMTQKGQNRLMIFADIY